MLVEACALRRPVVASRVTGIGDLVADGVKVDAVEINPAIVPGAEKFFGFDRSKLNLVVGDGRQFLHRATNRYDMVVLDVACGAAHVHLELEVHDRRRRQVPRQAAPCRAPCRDLRTDERADVVHRIGLRADCILPAKAQ